MYRVTESQPLFLLKLNYMTIKDEHIRLICKALNRSAGHRQEASKLLGISYRTLYRYLKVYPIIKINGKYCRYERK